MLTSTEAGAIAATIRVLTTGPTRPITSFYDTPAPGTLIEVLRTGEPAPGTGGVAFGDTYPSVDDRGNDDTDEFGRFAFSAVLDDASTGVWWYVPDCGVSPVALEGDPVPGRGDLVFGSLAGARVSVAGRVVVFEAMTVEGGDMASVGLFRAMLP
jgi:hypothetical protein